MKLNQCNALVAGKKGEVEKKLGDVYKIVQRDAVFDGMVRTYEPKDENGDKLPSEKKIVQQKIKDLMKTFKEAATELYDLTTTQDTGNQSARADIAIDGVTLLPQVPVTTLLFLEKQVNHILTFVNHLPTPAPEREWEYDSQSDLLKSKAVQTSRSKKVPRNHIKYEATKEHPAQVEIFTEDVHVGNWTQFEFSGKIPAQEKNAMLVRIRKLADAIKLAREQANQQDVKMVRIGETIFDYAFGV